LLPACSKSLRGTVSLIPVEKKETSHLFAFCDGLVHTRQRVPAPLKLDPGFKWTRHQLIKDKNGLKLFAFESYENRNKNIKLIFSGCFQSLRLPFDGCRHTMQSLFFPLCYQGCQMAFFQTNLGKFWTVLQ
jgi:hypothetical protein